MAYQGNLLSKTLVIGIIILFIGMSIVSSTENKIKDSMINYPPLESIEISKEALSRGKTAYAWVAYGGNSDLKNGAVFFDLDDPGNITQIFWTDAPIFFSGGTWTCDDRWLCCDDDSGSLWEIYPETGDMYVFGGGGTSCHGLAWDPVYDRLYATDGSNLIEYNPDTGEQEVIGSHNQPGKTMIALAINFKGVCYAWDVLFSGESTLFTVDLVTGEATEVASMGEPLVYTQDGAFDWDTGILYLAAYNTIGQLKTCDLESGELTLIGDFEGGAELAALAIPWWRIPHADFIWTPIHPNPSEMILFNASKSYDQYGHITRYEWDWDDDGVFDENHTSPTSTHIFEEVGYYPVTLRVVDNDNLTDRKTKTVRVGNQPPVTPVIEGKRRFKEGEVIEYQYTIYSIDPDEDDILYLINWSDGTQDETGYYASGEEITINVTIPLEKGTYVLFKMKARDIFGAESNWANLEVTVPRNRATISSLFQLFLERFPFLEVFLRAMNLLR